jgi:FKBP-type peptidyl-prolyl cis-trans isomerase
MYFPGKTLLMVVLMILAAFTQCRQDSGSFKKHDHASLEEPLIKANKEAVRLENEQINDYISRHKLEMQTTSTGVRFSITKKGIGARVEPGKTVKLDYTLMLLTGDTVYTALKDGPLVFEVGKGQVITGLEEAILLLRVGDHAKFIIPSHLAFGLIGDQKKILHKASLVYDLELISMY